MMGTGMTLADLAMQRGFADDPRQAEQRRQQFEIMRGMPLSWLLNGGMAGMFGQQQVGTFGFPQQFQ